MPHHFFLKQKKDVTPRPFIRHHPAFVEVNKGAFLKIAGSLSLHCVNNRN